jgi:hypothetical protein
VKLVLSTLREQGLVLTLRKVQERLRAPTTLGLAERRIVKMEPRFPFSIA